MHLAECTKIVLKDSFMIDVSCNSFSKIHSHPFFELVYVVDGNVAHTLGEKTHIIRPGDYFLVDLNSRHGYTAQPDTDRFEIINCMFLPSFLDPSVSKARDLGDILNSYLISFGGKNLHFSTAQECYHDDDGSVGNMVREALREYRAGKIGYVEIIRNLMFNILIRLARNESEWTADRDERDVVRYVRDYVHKHYAEPLTLSDISRDCYTSLSNLSKKFKLRTGMNFREYLQKVRVEKACSMLGFTDTKITEISSMLGYSDPSFFYHSFKEIMNMTPLEYRKQAEQIRDE